MLPRNTLYGTPSEIVEIEIPHSGAKARHVPIYQGSIDSLEKVASFTVTTEIQNRLSAGVLGLRLNTDANNGTILYEIYDMVVSGGGKFKVGTLLAKDKAGEY